MQSAEPSATGRAELTMAFAACGAASASMAHAFDALRGQVASLTSEVEEARAGQERMARHLAQIVDGLPGGVVVLDIAGAIAELNSKAKELLPSAKPGDPFEQALESALIDPHRLIGDLETRAGRFVTLARRSSPAGEIILLTDVTEAHVMQAYLQRQQRLVTLGELAAGLAHQIRTPLAAALLYASQMALPGLPAPDYVRCAAKTCERLRELDKLIDEMLAFARGASNVDVVSVSALLEQVAQWLHPALGSSTKLTIRTEAPDLKVRANAPSLVSALLNLATNAMQVTNGNLRIDMHARRTSDGAQITVSDDGPGVPETLRSRIFDAFFTTRANGNGLGLAIVKSVIEAHRGTIRLAPGQQRGACFIIDLPAEQAA